MTFGRIGFALILLASLGVPTLCRADEDVLYRADDFGRAHSEMTMCSGRMFAKSHTELGFIIDAEIPEGGSWTAGISRADHTVIWMILAKPVGAGLRRSHVELHSRGAKPEALDEVWQAIEKCAAQ